MGKMGVSLHLGCVLIPACMRLSYIRSHKTQPARGTANIHFLTSNMHFLLCRPPDAVLRDNKRSERVTECRHRLPIKSKLRLGYEVPANR
jgi:hypothetical protein